MLSDLSAKIINQDKKFSIIFLLAIATAKPNIPAQASKGHMFIFQAFSIKSHIITIMKTSIISLSKFAIFSVIISLYFLTINLKIIFKLLYIMI